jgi:hypothetical protein
MGLGFWKLVVGAGCISGLLMRFSFFAFLAFFFLEKAGSTPFFLFSLLSISTKFWSLRNRHEKLFFQYLFLCSRCVFLEWTLLCHFFGCLVFDAETFCCSWTLTILAFDSCLVYMYRLHVSSPSDTTTAYKQIYGLEKVLKYSDLVTVHIFASSFSYKVCICGCTCNETHGWIEVFVK